ncbi:MAG: class I SAM-dependent methyltransferase [archaeon]
MDLYESDFQFYLRHTNEKEILRKEITKIIRKLKIDSVLDVGAGNGGLSQPLSKEVGNYLCIEQRKYFADLLREKGLNVIEAEFPTEINEKFDMVLCSHSFPRDKEKLKIFLDAAWKLVKNNGFLLVITYTGDGEDWNKFLKKIGQKSFESVYVNYGEKLKLLKKFGKPKIKNLFSEVETRNIRDMIYALSFVAAGVKEERDSFLRKRNVIKKVLNEKYRRGKGYFFPFRHVFVLIKK